MPEGMTEVTFLVSVASGDLDRTDDDYVAGQSYEVPSDKADEFILKGYAQGALSRQYADDEVRAVLGQVQAINFGGEIDALENARRVSPTAFDEGSGS